MLAVEDYGRIRSAREDGLSIRAMARTFHHSRRKIREALDVAEPRPNTRSKDPPAPKLGPFKPIIDEILQADDDAPPKQRHTAAQIFRRLHQEHQYAGGYDQVRRYVTRLGRDRRETFIPLAHDPGQRLEHAFVPRAQLLSPRRGREGCWSSSSFTVFATNFLCGLPSSLSRSPYAGTSDVSRTRDTAISLVSRDVHQSDTMRATGREE